MAMLKRLYADERGTEMLEQIALLGFVILPLLAVVIAFRKKITTTFTTEWNRVKALL